MYVVFRLPAVPRAGDPNSNPKFRFGGCDVFGTVLRIFWRFSEAVPNARKPAPTAGYSALAVSRWGFKPSVRQHPYLLRIPSPKGESEEPGVPP